MQSINPYRITVYNERDIEMSDLKTIKTMVITAVATCFLIGVLLLIADYTNSIPYMPRGHRRPLNSVSSPEADADWDQADWENLYDQVSGKAYTDSDFDWIKDQARAHQQAPIIQIEIQPQVETFHETHNRISAELDQTFSSIWDTSVPPVGVCSQVEQTETPAPTNQPQPQYETRSYRDYYDRSYYSPGYGSYGGPNYNSYGSYGSYDDCGQD